MSISINNPGFDAAPKSSQKVFMYSVDLLAFS